MSLTNIKIIPMRRALFFDLDGTLWDALIPLCESWNEAMENNNLPYRFDLPTMLSYMGLTPLETVHLAFKDVDEETGLKYFDICFQHEIKYLSIHPGKLYPHEEEVIAKLSNLCDLYVVSNADCGYIENYLNACGMAKYFKGHLCAGDTKLDKCDNIKLLKDKENIDEVIYIGDTNKDMIETLKAGVPFIHASYGFGKIDNPPYKITSLLELEDIVRKIFKI